jgi:hypothetical protein
MKSVHSKLVVSLPNIPVVDLGGMPAFPAQLGSMPATPSTSDLGSMPADPSLLKHSRRA